MYILLQQKNVVDYSYMSNPNIFIEPKFMVGVTLGLHRLFFIQMAYVCVKGSL